jgi:phenylpropionate dioxygenase-like ring-hydroxylating dioxygenase large terminal subunit
MNASSWNYQPIPDTDLTRLGTAPVPAAPYYDPEYFELEREAVFKRTWLQIGHMCEIAEPGTFMVRPLAFAGASILVTHGKDGKLRAFHNVCTHRGTQLAQESSGKRSSFTCRYHGWNFGADGELRQAPDFERFYVEKKDCALRPVAVDACAGLVFVNLDPQPEQTLRQFLGPIADQLETLLVAKATTFSEYVYEVDANWKLTYDNFQETYHLRFIHSRTTAATFHEDNPFGYPIQYVLRGRHREKTIWANPAVAMPDLQRLGMMMGALQIRADGLTGPNDNKYYQIFPNFFILGSPIQHFSHTVIPVSSTKSIGVVRMYFVGDDESASKRFAREYALAFARDIHSEDVDIINAGQRGLNTGALQHIHFQEQEVLCRHLYHEVEQMVQAYKQERQNG